MTTYRERRERRVERLRGWAEARERDSDAAYEASKRVADTIPMGQPILVGHHSEKRHRRDIARIEGGMAASIEHGRTARRHEERADNIEAQLASSIYSDDPDAVERLEEKVARLEARRDEMKAANAAYRKEHRAELKAMSAYERSNAVPYASWAITNLGATIRTAKQRIEEITRLNAAKAEGRRIGGRAMLARFGGTCADCGGDLERGTPIVWYRSTREATHATCPTGEEE